MGIEGVDLIALNARRRTFVQAVQDVMREVRGQASLYEARQALQDAVNVIDASANWEFLLATRLRNLHVPLSTGTVSVASGTFLVTLTGSTWPTLVAPWGEYREIKFGDRGIPYKVDTVPTTTTLNLTTPLAGTVSTDIVNGTYVLFQARYPLPHDCEPGRDLYITGPDNIGPIKKLERMSYDKFSSVSQMGSWPMQYTDDEYDSANQTGTIRFFPYPTSAIEIKITYYRKMLVPSGNTEYMMIPEAFERAPILAAASNIMRKKNMQGWQQLRQEAGDLLNKMYNRYAASPAYEGKINPDYSDLLDGGSDDFYASDSLMYTR